MAETMAPRNALTATPASKQRRHGEVAANSRDAVHEERRDQSADEGECRQREEEQARRACRDGDHGANSAARRDADDARISHWVAEEALHGGACDAQSHPHRCAHDDARQPDLLDDKLLGAGELAERRSRRTPATMDATWPMGMWTGPRLRDTSAPVRMSRPSTAPPIARRAFTPAWR